MIAASSKNIQFVKRIRADEIHDVSVIIDSCLRRHVYYDMKNVQAPLALHIVFLESCRTSRYFPCVALRCANLGSAAISYGEPSLSVTHLKQYPRLNNVEIRKAPVYDQMTGELQ